MDNELLELYADHVIPFDEFQAIEDHNTKSQLLKMWLKNFSTKHIREEVWKLNSGAYYKLINELRIEKRPKAESKERVKQTIKKKDNQENKRVIIEADFTPVEERSVAIKEIIKGLEQASVSQVDIPKEPLFTFNVEDDSKNMPRRLEIIASLLEVEREGKLKVNIQVFKA